MTDQARKRALEDYASWQSLQMKSEEFMARNHAFILSSAQPAPVEAVPQEVADALTWSKKRIKYLQSLFGGRHDQEIPYIDEALTLLNSAAKPQDVKGICHAIEPPKLTLSCTRKHLDEATSEECMKRYMERDGC